MNLSDIINSNDYRRGYKAGVQDALDGKDKNFSGMGWSLKFAIHGSKALDTYAQGYNTGNLDGLRKKNQIFATENSGQNSINQNNINQNNTSKMSNQTSFNYQVEIAEGLKSYLHGFQERLAAVAGQYERKVNELHDSGGMMDESYETFVSNYLEPTKQRIQDLIDQINDSDIPFVERYIDYLESNPRG